MKIRVEAIRSNPVDLLRRAGYVFQRKEGDEMSFILPLSRAGYPRFHIYASVSGPDLNMSIHLDQKRETYGDDTRHHGEYEDSPILQKEVERIRQAMR